MTRNSRLRPVLDKHCSSAKQGTAASARTHARKHSATHPGEAARRALLPPLDAVHRRRLKHAGVHLRGRGKAGHAWHVRIGPWACKHASLPKSKGLSMIAWPATARCGSHLRRHLAGQGRQALAVAFRQLRLRHLRLDAGSGRRALTCARPPGSVWRRLSSSCQLLRLACSRQKGPAAASLRASSVRHVSARAARWHRSASCTVAISSGTLAAAAAPACTAGGAGISLAKPLLGWKQQTLGSSLWNHVAPCCIVQSCALAACRAAAADGAQRGTAGPTLQVGLNLAQQAAGVQPVRQPRHRRQQPVGVPGEAVREGRGRGRQAVGTDQHECGGKSGSSSGTICRRNRGRAAATNADPRAPSPSLPALACARGAGCRAWRGLGSRPGAGRRPPRAARSRQRRSSAPPAPAVRLWGRVGGSGFTW